MLDDTSNVSIRVIVAMALLVGAAVLIGAVIMDLGETGAGIMTQIQTWLASWTLPTP